jgi:hypothetical protein
MSSSGYIDKGARDEKIDEHHGRETHQGIQPNMIQCQQRESTAQKYQHVH